MKKQTLRTISTLSFLVVLSVSASNVRAFPTCPGCKPPAQYSAIASTQTSGPSMGLEVELSVEQSVATNTRQPDKPVDLAAGIWAELVQLFLFSL